MEDILVQLGISYFLLNILYASSCTYVFFYYKAIEHTKSSENA